MHRFTPSHVNSGPWITAYTLEALRALPTTTEFVLPIASLDHARSDIESLGRWILPPLYREGLGDFANAIVSRILYCFPVFGEPERNEKRVRVVELPAATNATCIDGRIAAFSVDTAVEEHGPHLPLGTDSIQSYGVLEQLAQQFDELSVVQPVDYGQLIWGLPFGFSVDLTAELLTNYVARYAQAIQQKWSPGAIYVVDVHGSIAHRQAIVEGLRKSGVALWGFRWLHEPLAEFASGQGDQHAGGVETALVEHLSSDLVDSAWWPDRIDDIQNHQMSFEQAVSLGSDLTEFFRVVDKERFNGVVGKIENYGRLDPSELFRRMLDLARADIGRLLRSEPIDSAGKELW